MSKKQKRMLYRIGGAIALFIPGMILEETPIGMVLLLAAYALIGWDILWRAAVNIRHGRVFDENFLMAIATIGALALSGSSTRSARGSRPMQFSAPAARSPRS